MASAVSRKIEAGCVRVNEDSMSLPTAGIGFDDPNTPYPEVGGYLLGATYPCTFHTHFLREELVTKEYKRITFENEYLLVEFAPDLGGRVWRLYDKVHQKDVIHHNDCVKPYPGGFGGAYCAGGIELNYPYAHSVTNTWPRKTEYRSNPDGSATYIVSEWERNGRTEWSMAFTLMPGEARLRQRVTIYNRSKLPAAYMYWGNAGVPVSKDTKWIYREAMGSEHGGDTIYYWPEFHGLDLSYYKEDYEVLGLYFLNPHYNFFGITDTGTLSGLVHYANRHDLPGKKLWTWGPNLSGENRSYHLSIKQDHYGEVQSGRAVNQEHLEWLMPDEFLTWDEAWSPIHGLAYVTETTSDAAFQLRKDEKQLVAYPFADISGQTLRFIVDGKVVRSVPFDGKAAEPVTIDLSDIADIAGLRVEVENDGEVCGVIALAGRCRQVSAKEVREEPAFREDSSVANYVKAEFSHKLLYDKKAMRHYREAIRLDPLNYKAHTGLGYMQFGSADFAAARASFSAAVDAYKWDPVPYLMLSHIDQIEGDLDSALENAFAARYYGERARSNRRVGEVHIARGEYASALKFLDEALLTNSRSLITYPLAAICERKLGRNSKASARLADTPDVPLCDMMWYAEKWFIGELDDAGLREALSFDEWRFIELGLDYSALGLYDEARRLLDMGIALHNKDGWEQINIYNPERLWGFFRKRENPFLHVLKGYIAAKEGCDEDVAASFHAGDYLELYVNTNEPELVPALRAAAAAGNKYANHYLGNFMYNRLRYDDAAKYWEAAPEFSGNLRNLAVHARFVEKDAVKGRDLLRRALDLSPNDVYLRQELVEAERACGTSAKELLDIYLAAPAQQQIGRLFYYMMGAFKAAGEWENAARFLADIDRSHCDEDMVWYDFCISYADHLVDEGKPAEALEWIARSRPTPPNLGYVHYSAEFLSFHREYYLTGLAYKKLGDAERAKESFERVVAQSADYYYFKPGEGGVHYLRFYVALAMRELGMDAAARGMLGGINTWRTSQALVLLALDKSELARWSEADPYSAVVVTKHTGPEI